MKMLKRGWIRIVEASIAIILVFGVILFLSISRQQSSEVDYSERARDILGEISRNVTLREAVLANNSQLISSSVSNRIPESYLDFEVRICAPEDICGKSTFTEGEVYAGERIISSTISQQNFVPRKLKVFIWRKE